MISWVALRKAYCSRTLDHGTAQAKLGQQSRELKRELLQMSEKQEQLEQRQATYHRFRTLCCAECAAVISLQMAQGDQEQKSHVVHQAGCK